MRRLLILLVLAIAGPWTSVAVASEVTVAVAANFAAPMAVIAERFTQASGHGVRMSVGSTGRLYSQIVAGAPFDLLLAADAAAPARLVADGLAAGDRRTTYAIGQLVLWSPQAGLVDVEGAVLETGRFRRLAMANPRLAPYGAAAMAVLRARGLDERLAPRIVTGDSVAQAFQFVATGNAELGFVALSQITAPGRPAGGSWWRVPQSLYPEIRQDAVLLRRGEDNPTARALWQFLREPAARAVIAAHGYVLAD